MGNKLNKTGLLVLMPIIILILFSFDSYALKVYLNDSVEHVITTLDRARLLNLSSNLSLQSNINHSFEGKFDATATKYNLTYIAGNNSGFLLGLFFERDAVTTEYSIKKLNCDGSTGGETCTSANCGGNAFTNYLNFTIIFNASASNANILINGVKQGSAGICTELNDVGKIEFKWAANQVRFKNNILLADNLNPSFSGNLPNITWPEDTSTAFNISGNFSDSNNDALTYTYSSVENISISINNATGVVNLTPGADFFGIRYAIFIANDSENITRSNNVTLNVTNANDLPSVLSTTISNADELNRTNGSLTASWTTGRAFSPWWVSGFPSSSPPSCSFCSWSRYLAGCRPWGMRRCGMPPLPT